jgi:hypothetical protein
MNAPYFGFWILNFGFFNGQPFYLYKKNIIYLNLE